MPGNEIAETKSLLKIRTALPGYEVYEWRHASAVLITDFPREWNDIREVLSRFRLKKSQVVVGGGSKSQMADWIDGELTRGKGWREREFETAIRIDQTEIQSPTHKVDCFKNKVGLEIEWNNKDPFFDRDLNNFRLLFDLRALAVGVIVTRSVNLEPLFKDLSRRGLKSKSAFGKSTTHMGKLLPKLEGGAGGGCPVLVLGITADLFDEDISDNEARALLARVEEAKAKRKARKPLAPEELDLLKAAEDPDEE
jgi:hypothetical protein